ncbi:MAG: endonuclease, partial [Chloroflexi bacterium]|nr:endonuclease [Chloroflexota bacterium]
MLNPLVCGDVFTSTYVIQGISTTSPLINSVVTLEGVVTADFQSSTQLDGFFVQDPSGDGNPLSSDGLFVYAPGGANVNVGEAVRVQGTVAEVNGLTEINTLTSLTVCSSGYVVTPTVIDLPVAVTGDQERYEGMLVTIPETLTASQNYFQGRYGQVTLSADGRLFHPNNGNG